MIDDIIDRLEGEGHVVPEAEEIEEPPSLSPLGNAATLQPCPSKPPPLASDLRILDRFKADLRLHGVVGEGRNGATLYLGITSRLLPKPVSLVVKGDSSTGKSFTTEQTVRFFPPEAIIAMTAMSEKALVYMKEGFSHRTLIIYEAVALKESAAAQRDDQTSYFVRSLISEGRLDYPVTVRDKDGGFVTKRIVKEGPTGLIITTTATRLHGENETRLLSLPTDDSREQTRRVLLQISDDVDPKGGPDLTEWLALQAWLQSANHKVTIPFARRLAEAIPAVAVRLRRDFSSILNLIKAHAILHQLNRERDTEGRIVASIEDYAVVRDLVADLVADGVEATVSQATREAVLCVQSLAAAAPGGVQVVAIARELNLDKSAAFRRVRTARERGYLENQEERRGRPGRYVIAEPLPEQRDLLPQPEALLQPRNPIEDKTAGQADGCAVARGSRRKRGEGR